MLNDYVYKHSLKCTWPYSRFNDLLTGDEHGFLLTTYPPDYFGGNPLLNFGFFSWWGCGNGLNGGRFHCGSVLDLPTDIQGIITMKDDPPEPKDDVLEDAPSTGPHLPDED